MLALYRSSGRCVTVTATIRHVGAFPDAVAVNPETSTAYVANSGSPNGETPGHKVSVLASC